MKPEDIRKNYTANAMNMNQLPDNPMELFNSWWKDVVEYVEDEQNAMSLSTVSKDGEVSSRTVLLKGIHENGFEFFTNYGSRKARDIEEHPGVAVLFFWKELERQVRIQGTAKKVSAERSAVYFQSRPIESQISAWASPQSQPVEGREQLMHKVEEIKKQFGTTGPLPPPPFWGGYVVSPYRIEFWQGRADRLHDRVVYELSNGAWIRSILAP